MINKDALLNRFIKYTKVDTRANPEAKTMPSSKGQLELAQIVKKDFEEAGVKDIKLNDQGFLFGTIESNIPKNHKAYGKVPVIGYLSHFDTAAECSGTNVKAQIIRNYDGSIIKYPNNKELFLSPEEDPELKEYIGNTIITTDGTTLLGADDKAGIAGIVEMAEFFMNNPDLLHGKIRIVIIPDEELGIGAHKLDIKEYGVDVAYTIDGGVTGEIDVESFNGFGGKVTVKGNSAFPGYGKGCYLNATKVLSEFVSMMDENKWPDKCDGREGIWWVDVFNGGVGDANLTMFLRDFDLEGIEQKKKELNVIKDKLLKRYPKAIIDIDIEKKYLNYKYELDKEPRVVKYAEEAMKRIKIVPKRSYVRGGNDACALCFAGLPATNLFIGMRRFHSLKEWISLEVMEKGVETIIELTKVWMDKSV